MSDPTKEILPTAGADSDSTMLNVGKSSNVPSSSGSSPPSSGGARPKTSISGPGMTGISSPAAAHARSAAVLTTSAMTPIVSSSISGTLVSEMNVINRTTGATVPSAPTYVQALQSKAQAVTTAAATDLPHVVGTGSHPGNQGSSGSSEESEGETSGGLHYTVIYLWKQTPEANLKLTDEEMCGLILDKIGVPLEDLHACQQPELNMVALLTKHKIHVVLHGIEVKQGVITASAPFPVLSTGLNKRPSVIWVNIHDFDLRASAGLIEEVLSNFGHISSPCTNYTAGTGGRMKNIWGGDRRLGMILHTPIPNQIWVAGGLRARVIYRGQPRRCNQCGLTEAEGCPAGAVAADCARKNSPKADMREVWNILFARARGETVEEDILLIKAQQDEDRERATWTEERRRSTPCEFNKLLRNLPPIQVAFPRAGDGQPRKKKKKRNNQQEATEPLVEVEPPTEVVGPVVETANAANTEGTVENNMVDTESAGVDGGQNQVNDRDVAEAGAAGGAAVAALNAAWPTPQQQPEQQAQGLPQRGSQDPEVRADAADVVELFNIPVNKGLVCADDIKRWLLEHGFQEEEGENKGWKICNIPTRKKSWLLAGLSRADRLRIFQATDRRITTSSSPAGYIFKTRPYPIQQALKDNVTGGTFDDQEGIDAAAKRKLREAAAETQRSHEAEGEEAERARKEAADEAERRKNQEEKKDQEEQVVHTVDGGFVPLEIAMRAPPPPPPPPPPMEDDIDRRLDRMVREDTLAKRAEEERQANLDRARRGDRSVSRETMEKQAAAAEEAAQTAEEKEKLRRASTARLMSFTSRMKQKVERERDEEENEEKEEEVLDSTGVAKEKGTPLDSTVEMDTSTVTNSGQNSSWADEMEDLERSVLLNSLELERSILPDSSPPPRSSNLESTAKPGDDIWVATLKRKHSDDVGLLKLKRRKRKDFASSGNLSTLLNTEEEEFAFETAARNYSSREVPLVVCEECCGKEVRCAACRGRSLALKANVSAGEESRFPTGFQRAFSSSDLSALLAADIAERGSRQFWPGEPLPYWPGSQNAESAIMASVLERAYRESHYWKAPESQVEEEGLSEVEILSSPSSPEVQEVFPDGEPKEDLSTTQPLEAAPPVPTSSVSESGNGVTTGETVSSQGQDFQAAPHRTRLHDDVNPSSGGLSTSQVERALADGGIRMADGRILMNDGRVRTPLSLLPGPSAQAAGEVELQGGARALSPGLQDPVIAGPVEPGLEGEEGPGPIGNDSGNDPVGANVSETSSEVVDGIQQRLLDWTPDAVLSSLHLNVDHEDAPAIFSPNGEYLSSHSITESPAVNMVPVKKPLLILNVDSVDSSEDSEKLYNASTDVDSVEELVEEDSNVLDEHETTFANSPEPVLSNSKNKTQVSRLAIPKIVGNRFKTPGASSIPPPSPIVRECSPVARAALKASNNKGSQKLQKKTLLKNQKSKSGSPSNKGQTGIPVPGRKFNNKSKNGSRKK